MTIAGACCARAATGNDRRQAAASINALKRFMNNPSIEQLDERTSGTGRHRPAIEDYRKRLFTLNAFILVIDA
jgi:hypothetical protein